MSRDLILIAFSLMTWGVGEGMFLYFQPLYLQQLGARPVVIGAILGAVGIVMTIAHIPAGYLADRIGRRPLIWVSWIMGMIAAWLMALAKTLPFFVIGLLIYSITAFVVSPLNSYITSARGKLSVGRALTLISVFYNIGAIAGPVLGGVIGNRLGLHRIYPISASLFLISVIIILYIRSQPVEHHLAVEEERKFTFDRGYITYLLITFIVLFSTYFPQPLSQNFLQNERSLDLAAIGRLGSIASLGVVTLNLALGSIHPRIGFSLGQVCVGLFSLLLWRGSGFGFYAMAYFLVGGYRVVRTLAAAQTRSMVHQANMGLAYGITETIGASAVILAPPLAGYLYEINPLLIYILSLLIIGVSLLASLAFYPSQRSIPEPQPLPLADQ